jgi:hypothetical protein
MSGAGTNAGLGRADYFASNGYSRDADLISQPEAYAVRLISYIRDDSTVRARVADRFGRHRLPSIEQIAALRLAHAAETADTARRYTVADPTDYDEFDFCPTPEPFTALVAASRLRDRDARNDRLRRLRDAEELVGRRVIAQAGEPGRPIAAPRANPREMLQGAAKIQGVQVSSLLGRSRKRIDVQNRSLACALMRTCRISWTVIGRMMAGRDHSTVHYNARVFFDRDRFDPEFSAAWEALAPCIFRAVRTFEELQAMTELVDG